MKYRRLTSEELEQLQDNFIRFLAAQSITGMDWTTMKTANPERAEELIEQFSDVVIEKTLHNVEYLEYKEKQDMKMFHCQEDKIVMFGLFAEGATDLDFTSNDAPDVMMEKMKSSNANLKVYTAEKVYKDGKRLEEIFRMIENGSKISPDGAMYKTLKGLVQK
jgi:hypothetical protein